jgi:hypothetical protein
MERGEGSKLLLSSEQAGITLIIAGEGEFPV